MSPERSIPLNEIPPGSTLFVAGSAVDRARALALAILFAGSTADDGLLLTTTETPSDTLLTLCNRLYSDREFPRVAVIDCTGQQPGDRRADTTIESLATPADLTGLGIKFSVMHETISNAGANRVLTGVFTISTLVEQTDLRPTIRFLQTAAGRIDGTAGLGLFVLDPSVHDGRTVSTLQEVCDGWIEVRAAPDGTDELRIRGLSNQPEGWTPFSVPE